MTRPSDVQQTLLIRAVSAGQPLVRRSGGFWCIADSVDDVLRPRPWRRGEFSVSLQTVRALERRAARVGAPPDAFDDPRVVTDLGKQEVARRP